MNQDELAAIIACGHDKPCPYHTGVAAGVAMNARDLVIDDSRVHLPETGIYVRARSSAGNWQNSDIAHLDRDSLHDWLRSRGGDNPWAENTVLILLGHYR